MEQGLAVWLSPRAGQQDDAAFDSWENVISVERAISLATTPLFLVV